MVQVVLIVLSFASSELVQVVQIIETVQVVEVVEIFYIVGDVISYLLYVIRKRSAYDSLFSDLRFLTPDLCPLNAVTDHGQLTLLVPSCNGCQLYIPMPCALCPYSIPYAPCFLNNGPRTTDM